MTNPQGLMEAFRIIFLVEDNQGMGRSLCDLLPHYLPGMTVVWKETIEDALSELAIGCKPSIGLLDIKVPLRRSMNPEANPQVADRLRELGIPSLCMTGFSGSSDVNRYLERRHSLLDPPIKLIEKRETPDFLQEIVGEIRGWVGSKVGPKLEANLEDVFESNAMTRWGLTPMLMSLEEDIRDCWPYLSEGVKQTVSHYLEVEERNGQLSFDLRNGDETR